MKKLILILGGILLGCFIFGLLLNDDSSIKSSAKKVMQYEIDQYQQIP